jgi:WD40 repeat protein
MKRVWLAATAAAMGCSWHLAAGELQRDVLAIDYAKDKGLVAAAFRGGQVVVWEFESGHVKKAFNESAPKNTLNKPLAQFNASGRLLALTEEGDPGLISYDLETGKSTVLVPHRLLVRGITALNWSHLGDSLLVSIGRDIFLIDAAGHMQWQRRLETRAIITDVVWHPSEKFYTVATDNGEVSTWETSSGRVLGASKLEMGGHSTAVKVGWTSEDSLVALASGTNLALLDPETLKLKKAIPCNCQDFAWSPNGKEIFAWAPPNVAAFTEAGQKTHELRTTFEGESPVVWVGEGRLLTAFSDSTVVLRDARNGKILRTFTLPVN